MYKHQTTPEAGRFLMRGAEALSRVEAAGVRVDTEYLESASSGLEKQIAEVESRMRDDKEVFLPWRRRCGRKTNMGSRGQLSKVLFEDLGLAPKGVEQEDWTRYLKTRSKGGAMPKGEFLTTTKLYKSGKADLDHIDLEFVKDFVLVETLKKTQTTYLAGIRREMVRHADGHWYVHPTFPLNGVRSYRSSSKMPNWQNNPTRDPALGELVRRAYVPRPGNYFVEVDYSTLEVRISCAYHKDPTLMKYVEDDYDMHGDMACQLFLMDKSQVGKKTTRHVAKNGFVFPAFYGSVYFQCAPNMWEMIGPMKTEGEDPVSVRKHLKRQGVAKLGNCDPDWIKVNGTEEGTFVHHVKVIEQDFWSRRFRVYDQWKKDWYDQYKRDLGFPLLTGFACNGVFKRNDVTNYPVQGSAFHCLLWSLTKLVRLFDRYKMRTLILGEIHDSIQLDVPPDELQDVLTMCEQVMTDDLPRAWDWINTPLGVEAEVSPLGECWHMKAVWEEDGKGVWSPKPKK